MEVQPGMKFERLEVIGLDHRDSRSKAYYKCRCECGTEKVIRSDNLTTGKVQSCGCQFCPVQIGMRFERLEVIERLNADRTGYRYLCLCDCGNETNVRGSHLTNGQTKSCGCLRREAGKRTATHSKTRVNGKTSKVYQCWINMRRRCNDPTLENYARYGGRGIRVCDEWNESFEAFYACVGDMPDGVSLDRIDNDGNYEPGNVRLVDATEQANNKSTNRHIEYNGKTQTVAQWAKELALSPAVIYKRLEVGWSDDLTLSIPVQCNA